MAKQYPAKYSRLTLTLNDGEVKEYDITAGCALLPYLMREAADTGSMVILNGDESYAVPMEKISDASMKEFNSPEERDAFYGVKKGH